MNIELFDVTEEITKEDVPEFLTVILSNFVVFFLTNPYVNEVEESKEKIGSTDIPLTAILFGEPAASWKNEIFVLFVPVEVGWNVI